MRDYLNLYEIRDVLDKQFNPDEVTNIMDEMETEAQGCLCAAWDASECCCGAWDDEEG